VGRLTTSLLVLGLLTGTAAAFAVAESLKLEKSPITGTLVDKVFSPVCDCPTASARISFKLRKADRLSLTIIDSQGRRLRTLAGGRRLAGGRHDFAWDGRDNDGRLVPEGRYRPRVDLGNADRTIVLPNPIRVDTTRPRVIEVDARPRVFSPDGDGRSDRVKVRYRLSERGRPLLFVNGPQRVRGRSQKPTGELDWYGRVEGRALPPGGYRLQLAAVDPAGNVSRRAGAGVVRLRFVELYPRALRVRPGEPFTIAVSTDAKRVRWLLRRGSSVVARGSAEGRVTAHAPAKPGRHVLTVEAGRHRARALVIVTRRA